MIQSTSIGTVMGNPATHVRIDGHTLLKWCGYAVLAGLFLGIGTGSVMLR